MTITLEEMPAKKAGKPETAQTVKSAPARPMTDAERFAGQPLVLHHKLNMALNELFFYRATGRHHDARETNEVRNHRQWKDEAAALCLALRDSIAQGLLEPVKPQRGDDDA